MIDRPILYSFRRCPYALRARLALIVSGTAFELREVKLAAKPAAMISASPKGTVPVLVLPGGSVIDESLDIMRWTLGRNDPERWLGGDDLALIGTNDGAFKHHLDRYKYPQRYGSDATEHRHAALAFLKVLEERLGSHAYLCGESRALADAAIMPFVRQFAATDLSWFGAQPFPAVQDWLARHLVSALFVSAMIRVPPWQPGDAAVLIGQ